MKMKFVRNGRTQRRELLIAAQRGETLDKKRAARLADNPSTLLLGFAYETPRGGPDALLHYDVEGLWSLKTYLSKRALSQEELMGLLRATERVLDLCAEERLDAEGLLFDPEYLFVDAQCCPRFALVPLSDVPFQTRNSPLTLLAAAGGASRLRFATPDAEGLSRRLGAFAEDQGGVFSLNTFRRFLEDEDRGDDAGGPEGRHGAAEPSTGSVWVTAGGTSEAPDTSGGSFFWSPLSGMVPEQEPAAPAPASVTPAVSPSAPAAPAPAMPQPEMAPVTPVPVEPAPAAPVPEVAQPAPAPQPVPAPAPAPVPIPALDPASQSTAAPTPAPVVPATEAPVPHVPPQESAPVAPAPVAPQPAPAPQPATPAAAAPAGVRICRLSTGDIYALPVGTEVKLGRGSGCEVQLLGNRKLSRFHVALTSVGPAVVVRDLGAVNGVWVNGQRLSAQQTTVAQAGQRIRLADEELIILNG